MSERAPKQQLEIVTKLAQDGSERHYVPNPEGKLGQRISEDYYHELSDEFDVVNNFEEPAKVPVDKEDPTSAETSEKSDKRDWETNPVTDEERKKGREARRSSVVEDGREKGFKDFYKAGEEADAEAAKKRDAEAKREAMDKRRNSAEVSALNDMAELRIYGSRGRKYTHPRTGEELQEVKSARERIMDDSEKGVFPGASVSHKDRKAFADAYENSINELLEQGFELTQAEYLTSMRMRDLKTMHDIDTREQQQVLKFMSENGMSQEVAQAKAKQLFDKLRNAQMTDAERLQLARDNGYMTMSEFMNGVKGDTPDDTAKPGGKSPDKKDTPEPKEVVKFTDEQNEAIKKAKEAADVARGKYEDIMLYRQSHTLNLKKGVRGKDLQAAYDAWMEAENHAGALVASAFATHGINADTSIKKGEANPDRDALRWLKAQAALATIDAHSASLKEKIEKSSEVEGPFKTLKKFRNKFAEMYANFGAVKPGQNPEEESRISKSGPFTKKVIKAGAILGAGALVALPLAPFLLAGATMGAAGTATSYGVSRVARGGLIAQIKKAENQRLGITRVEENRLAAHEAINATITGTNGDKKEDKFSDPSLDRGTKVFKDATEKVVTQNRLRAGAGFVLGAAGGALVEGLADDAWDGIKAGTGKVGDAAEWAWDGVTPDDADVLELDGDVTNGEIPTPEPDTPGGNGLGVPDSNGEGAGSIADQITTGNGEQANPLEGQPDFTGQEPVIAGDQTNPGIGGSPTSTTETLSNTFDVEVGNGVQTEINDALESWGYGRNDQLSAQLLQEASSRFPEGLLANNSTGAGWNELITAPGSNSWNPGVAEFLQQRAEEILSAKPTIPTAE